MPVTAPDLEGNIEPFGERLRGGLGGAHIGAHGDVHADEARGTRQDGADQEAERNFPAEQQADHDEDHDADGADRGVLPLEIGLRAFRDRACDLLHARTSRIQGHDRFHRDDAVSDGDEASQDDQRQSHKVFSRR